MDTNMNVTPRPEFPADRPVEALVNDHNMVRHLVDAYRNSDTQEVKIEIIEQVLALLETHSRLEESVFYPAVRDVDAAMIAHFEEEHQKTDEILVALKRIALKDPKAMPMFEQLIDMTMHHIREEETEFFPKLELANMDLTPIGLQMQAFEANLIHAQAQAREQEVRR